MITGKQGVLNYPKFLFLTFSLLPTDVETRDKLLHDLVVELRDLLLFLGRLPQLTPHTLATCSSSFGNTVNLPSIKFSVILLSLHL